MENKKNRNKRLAIIAAMLALIVLILCLGGNTFAKYISANTYEAKNVTVAKWGFVVTASSDNMFSKQYSKGNIVTDAAASDADNPAAVDIQATTLTVAPGASGSMTFGITGSAEVLAKLTMELTGDDIALVYAPTNNSSAEETYNPIKWTLKKTGTGGSTLVDGKTLKDVKTALTGEVAATTIEIGGPAINLSYELSWVWAFNVDDNTDAKDTALGLYTATKEDKAEDGITSAAKTTFDITTATGDTTTTVEQTINTDKTVVNFNFKLVLKVEQAQNS